MSIIHMIIRTHYPATCITEVEMKVIIVVSSSIKI